MPDQTAQGARQASIRAVTGSAETYEGDWHRLFDLASIPVGTFNGRLLAWINQKLSTSYTNLPEAQQAMAVANGAYNWASMGTFSASSSIAAPFAKVNGPTDGPASGPYEAWSVDYASQPTILTPVAFTVSRQGYSAAAAATTYLDTFYVTSTVRQPYPNQASQSSLTAALSDYIYSTDTPSGGVTNNSTYTSPKPVANWAMRDRRCVGNSVRLEVVCGHRNARGGLPVACVVFTATSSGSGTATQTVATPTILGHSGDLNPVIGYACDLDISALSDNASFTVDAVVYPWIGGAGTTSLKRSADGTAANLWEFNTLTFLKNTTRAANPPLAYVTAGGNDATGVVSTTAATAKATPFLTFKGALQGLKAQNADGFADGCEIRISNTTADLSTAVTAGTYTNVAEVTVTRDPTVAVGSCILNFGAANVALRAKWLRIRDVTLTRNGAFNVGVNSGGFVTLESLTLNNASNNAQVVGTGIGQIFMGVAITNPAASNPVGAGNGQNVLTRGVSMTGSVYEALTVLGCTLNNCSNTINATRTANNGIVWCTKFPLVNVTSGAIAIGVSADVNGFMVGNCLLEYTSATANPAFRISADSTTGNTTHVLLFNNTIVGAVGAGRSNWFYDEGATARTHKLMASKGNIAVQLNTKSDIAVTSSTRLGNWAYYYGVGCAGNWSQYAPSNATNEGQVYAGKGTSLGTGSTTATAQMANSYWTSFQGTTATAGPTYSAGSAPPGTYTLNANAPIKGILTDPVLPYDLAGTARSTTADTPGAYVAP